MEPQANPTGKGGQLFLALRDLAPRRVPFCSDLYNKAAMINWNVLLSF